MHALDDSKILINTHDSPMFLSKNEFKSLSKGNKTYRMEAHSIKNEKKYNILVDEEGNHLVRNGLLMMKIEKNSFTNGNPSDAKI